MTRGPKQPTERTVARALARLASPGAILAPLARGDGFGVFLHPDRRSRPILRISATQAKALLADGALRAAGADDVFVLTPAGAARAVRASAAPEESFAAQHGRIVDRAVMDGDGDARRARGYAAAEGIARLAALKGADGSAWLSRAEIEAARRLRSDWDAGQAGVTPGSDWTAPPRAGGARQANGREAALAIGMDARTRVDAALSALAPALRRIVCGACLEDRTLAEIERAEAWPPRAGKIALKMALAQLAAQR